MDIGFQEFENHKGTTRAQSDPVNSYGVTCSVCELSQSYTDVESGSYFYNEEILAENGKCNFYWPTEMYKISFFAYAPYGNSLFKLSSAKTKTGWSLQAKSFSKKSKKATSKFQKITPKS